MDAQTNKQVDAENVLCAFVQMKVFLSVGHSRQVLRKRYFYCINLTGGCSVLADDKTGRVMDSSPGADGAVPQPQQL